MAPAPDSAKTEFHYAIRRFRFVETFAAINNAEILEKFRQRRRFESQPRKFDAVAVHVQHDCLLPGNDQPSENSKLRGFPPEELDQRVGIIERTRINNHRVRV